LQSGDILEQAFDEFLGRRRSDPVMSSAEQLTIRTQGDPMRALAVNTFMSLDGVVQSPGGPDEDPTGGFTHGGWGVNYFDEEMMGQVAEADPYELLLGRGTYEIFAAHWPYTDGPIADRLNSTRKHVASTTLEQVEWNNSTLITGDVAEYVATLKSQDGPEIQVHGSPGLIQTLLKHDLIDEFRIWIFPVVIGTGKRFVGDGTIPAGLKLLGSTVSKTGVTINT
jgi:dihydrofolate reductase